MGSLNKVDSRDVFVTPTCYVNGKRHELPPARGEATLLSYLRECGLTGTKLGCGEGGCGACTVMVSNLEKGEIVHKAVNACLFPLYAADGAHIITVEGIGNTKDGLHPVQEHLSKSHGSQCGFCTPGFIMSMYSLLRSKKGAPTESEIEECLAGNLCRCTGYRPILDAFKIFAQPKGSDYSKEGMGGKEAKGQSSGGLTSGVKLCPTTGRPCDCGGGAAQSEPSPPASSSKIEFPSEPIFPNDLHKRETLPLNVPGGVCNWHRPVTLEKLLEAKQRMPHGKLVVGNTEVGIEMKFKHAGYQDLIDVNHIPELKQISIGEEGVTIGAATSLTNLMRTCESILEQRPSQGHRLSIFSSILEQLRWFAGNQIRNVASLGGNIVTGSPISDLNPLLIAGNATFKIKGLKLADRDVPAANFFLGYRKVDMQPHEILYEVFILYTKEHEFVKEFKQARRREDDIAIVTAGMRVKLRSNGKDGWVVQDSSIAYGGVAAKTISAKSVEKVMLGKPWSPDTFKAALDSLKDDVVIAADAPGGMSEFRFSLAASFLFKFFLHVSDALEIPVHERHLSSIEQFNRPPSHGIRYYAETKNSDEIVGNPERHLSADMQVCGEAKYFDDVDVAGCLHAALVTSSKPHANIVGVDASAALAVEGVHGFYSYKDVPGSNIVGPIVPDEELFASKKVTCVGQVIGVTVATTQAIAQLASRLVKIEYEELDPILTIRDAVEAQSFFDEYPRVECGDVDSAFQSCDHVIEGENACGGQEHFYLEPQGCVVVPDENLEMTMLASTQAPYKHTSIAAKVLGVPEHKIVCKTKRIGGGFGGKESRSAILNAAIAVPAFILKKPVKLCLDRDQDMQITGHRHAFLSKYKVGFNSDGKIVAADVKLYSNAGNSLDLSVPIMDRAVLHSDNSYKIPNMRINGRLCKTNTPSNTAFRGFGGPQGSLLTEMFVDRVARVLELKPEEVRSRNLYSAGDVTHFGQRMEDCQVRRCWEEVVASSSYSDREVAVAQFNAANRFRKRGLALTPTKFGISFTAKFMNQGGALVHVYTDGSVLVTHGGVEMGQGLHTKMCQVAASALKVPLTSVFISETSTDKVPNASPTAASASSDLYGGAILDACQKINKRLAPFRAKLPGASMEQIVKAAYLERVDLSAHGFYATPDITGAGGDKPFNYFCYGAASTEVELDVLTGDWHILRVDIVMDVGNPINPAIDIGQVEGGFVQGMGWLCMEELVWGDSSNPWVRRGHLHTAGPGTYKIPTANDIPIDFRVSLLKNSANPRVIHSSKAVGEPPFLLAQSAFFALKEAVYTSREEAGLQGWFRLDAPCTPERLRLACGVAKVEDLKEIVASFS
ncbi:hypothetical protein BSKO_07193 [Bryopsis sp. KO-2023]|nr:hypothetical protein BSKO_07193 [Bryopsis sp. KO-2023]